MIYIIIKHRKKPKRISILEAVLQYIAPNYPRRSDVEKDLAIRRAGVYGEQSVDYYLKQLNFEKHVIIQDLRLQIAPGVYTQMDNLLFSPRYFLNYDSKHIAGDIKLDEYQMTRELDGYVETFANPIVQVENQQHHLEQIIAKHTKIHLPGTSFVVFTHPKSIIHIDQQYPLARQKVIRPQQIRHRSISFMKKNPNNVLDERQFNDLLQFLIKNHTPEDPDILSEYQIPIQDILTGMYCEHCKRLSIERRNRSWICSICNNKSKDAHIKALMAYYLLLGPRITNRRCRYFLNLSSVSIASKLLRSLNLKYEGSYRNRTYLLDYEGLEKLLEARK